MNKVLLNGQRKMKFIEKFFNGDVEMYNTLKKVTRDDMIAYIALYCIAREYDRKDILILCDEVAGLTYALKKDLENV